MDEVKKTIKGLSRQQLALLSEKLKVRTVQTPQHTPEPKIERRPDRFAPCRLSFAQQRLWFIEQKKKRRRKEALQRKEIER